MEINANVANQQQRVQMSRDPYERAEQMRAMIDDVAKQQKWNPQQTISFDFSFYQVLIATIADLARELQDLKEAMADETAPEET